MSSTTIDALKQRKIELELKIKDLHDAVSELQRIDQALEILTDPTSPRVGRYRMGDLQARIRGALPVDGSPIGLAAIVTIVQTSCPSSKISITTTMAKMAATRPDIQRVRRGVYRLRKDFIKDDKTQ